MCPFQGCGRLQMPWACFATAVLSSPGARGDSRVPMRLVVTPGCSLSQPGVPWYTQAAVRR